MLESKWWISRCSRWRIQDFLEGATNLERGKEVLTYYSDKTSWKLHENEEYWRVASEICQCRSATELSFKKWFHFNLLCLSHTRQCTENNRFQFFLHLFPDEFSRVVTLVKFYWWRTVKRLLISVEFQGFPSLGKLCTVVPSKLDSVEREQTNVWWLPG